MTAVPMNGTNGHDSADCDEAPDPPAGSTDPRLDDTVRLAPETAPRPRPSVLPPTVPSLPPIGSRDAAREAIRKSLSEMTRRRDAEAAARPARSDRPGEAWPRSTGRSSPTDSDDARRATTSSGSWRPGDSDAWRASESNDAAKSSGAGPRPSADRAAPPPETTGGAVGNLRDLCVGADALLPRIRDAAASGYLLFLGDGDADISQEMLYVRRGEVLACRSLLRAPIRGILIEAGVVDAEQSGEAERAARASGAAPEVELIRAGVVTREQILETVGAAVREAALGAMTQPFGMSVWKEAERIEPPKTLCRIPMEELILRYARRVPDPIELLARAAKEDRPLAYTRRFEEIRGRLRLLPNEWKFLFRVDGRRSTSEIRGAMNLSEEDFARVVLTTIVTGMVAPSEAREAPSAAVPPAVPPAAPSVFAAPVVAREAPPPTPAPPVAEASVGIPPASVPVAAPAPRTPEPPAPAVRESPPRPRILVVDDSPTVQKLVAIALKDAGCDLEFADDGMDALELAAAAPPDLIVMDVVMPRLDGYKTCACLKRMLGPRMPPVVMLTAKDGTFDRIRARLSGVSAFLGKPFAPGDLLALTRANLPTRPS